MINYISRLVKRFAVLVPGLVIAYFAVRDIFPHIEKRVPDLLALFVTYLLAAYVLIPAALRLLRIIFPTRHLPLYCVTPDGFASDPLNIGIVGTRAELITAMTAAGWHKADDHSLSNIFREGLSYLFKRSYPNAPVSTLYLLGRKQDIAFEIPVEGSRGKRHHVRFWATTFEPDKPLDQKTIYWHSSKFGFPESERVLWLGAASLDVGITAIRHNFQITHMIHPDTNSERDLIIRQLKSAGMFDSQERVRLAREPYKLVNRAWRGYLETDGTMVVCHLRKA